MAEIVVNVRTHVAWWLKPYLRIVTLGAWLGWRVDLEVAKRRIRRAISVDVVKAD